MERFFIFIGGIWFVNLVNFMDGIDWITVAEVVPITAAIILIGWIGSLSDASILVAAALLGATVGFAPFNKPKARLFLGDVGSLPVGLLLAWLLLQLAEHGHWVAAVLLPLYYLLDATLTLMKRLLRRERFWLPHRSHYYQRAVDGGFGVLDVVHRVFGTNIALVALAVVSIAFDNVLLKAGCLAAGAMLVALTLRSFVHEHKSVERAQD